MRRGRTASLHGDVLMSTTVTRTMLSADFAIDHSAVARHVIQPAHTRNVISSRGLEEGIKAFARPKLPGVTLGFNTDGFVRALNAALADNTAGYAMQLRRHGNPIASAEVNWAKRPADGSEAWADSVRMHIARCSKLITAIAMTRALA